MSNNLKQVLAFRNMSQSELATKSNISRNTISLIVNDKLNDVKRSTMQSISDAVGFSVNDIFFATDVRLAFQE